MSDVSESNEKFQRLRQQLKDYFKERGDVIDGALTALLSKHHILLIGPPGTAKTNMAETLCKSIKGAHYFFSLLTKYTTDKDLLISEVLVEEKAEINGKLIKFINRSDNKLPQAHIAFLDEIFKCSVITLNALLRLINERKCVINSGEEIFSPLITLIGASNELPSKSHEELFALNDRFLLRYLVDYLSINEDRTGSFFEMLSDKTPPPTETITLDELHLLQGEVDKIKVRSPIYNLISNIRSELKIKFNIQPSDRRYKQSIKALKAYAYLNGHIDAVRESDLMIFEHILWLSRDLIDQENIQKVLHGAISKSRST